LAGCTGNGGGNGNGDGGGNGNGNGNGNGDGGGSATITVAHFLPESHHITQEALNPWMEKVKQKSDTDVTFDVQPSGQLGGPGDMLNLIKQGTADISLVSPAYLSDQIPLSGVGELPDTFFSAEVGCKAYWNLSQNQLHEKEYSEQDVRVVNLSLEAPYQLVTVDRKVETLEDWEGLNVRSAGGIMSTTIEALGGTPVEIQAPEVNTAFDRGTVDGSAIAEPSVPAFDLVQFLSYATTNINVASWVGLWTISESSYGSLPSDVQTALIEAGSEASVEAGAAFDDLVGELRNDFESSGVELVEIEDDEYERWSERMATSEDEWASQMSDRGLPGREMIDVWRSKIESVR
jgi:TRAP-type C4-dicarboxylate transport system substrate-binding protein